MTLSVQADELLADLQDGEGEQQSGDEQFIDEEAQYRSQRHQPEAGSSKAASAMMEQDPEENDASMQLPEGGVRPAEELEEDDVNDLNLKAVQDVRKVAKLASSKAFQDCVQV